MRPVRRVALASLLATLLALPAGAGARARPTFTAGAPRLGGRLALTLSGAQPGARVRLFHSTAAGSARTPAGLLELRRSTLTLLAVGVAGSDGRFAYERALPLEPALAEAEGHFQALVCDPLAPSGARLSQAVHLRLLGTRLYVRCRDDSGPGPWGAPGGAPQLRILSAVDDSLVAIVPLSTAELDSPGAGEPVLSADLALGAVLLQVSPTSSSVVVFDHFDGSVRGRVALAAAADRLLVAPDGRSVLALERQPVAAIARIDLESAQVVARVPLPEQVSALWTCDAAGTTAYVAEHVGASPGRTAIRRVDLATLTPMDSLRAGEEDSVAWLALRCLGDRLYASTATPLTISGRDGYLTLVEVAEPWGPPRILDLAGRVTGLPTPVPAAEMLLVPLHCSFQGCEDTPLSAGRLRFPVELHGVGWGHPPPWILAQASSISWRELVPEGPVLWGLDNCCDHDSTTRGGLYSLDTSDGSWRRHAFYPSYQRPLDLEVLHDALVHKLYVSVDGYRLPGLRAEPLLHVIAPAGGESRRLSVGWEPVGLSALTVP